MGNSVKGLHDGSRVLLIYDRLFDTRGNLFNELLVPIASMLEVTWSEGLQSQFLRCPRFVKVAECPTYVSHLPNHFDHHPGCIWVLARPGLVACDCHVMYDLPHSTSPLSIVASH